MNTEHDWTVWWHDEGSGMRPKGGQDHESHVRDMTRIAWLNGAFGAADEIERLRKEHDEAEPLLDELWDRRTEATELRSEIERLRAERDEARRLYCKAVEEIERGMSNDSARDVAKAKGWDCFDNYTEEEVTDDGSAEF